MSEHGSAYNCTSQLLSAVIITIIIIIAINMTLVFATNSIYKSGTEAQRNSVTSPRSKIE